MFLDSKIGFLLLITHFLAALLVGVIFRFYPFTFNTLKKSQAQKNELLSEKNKGSFSLKSSSSPLLNDKKRIALSELGSIMGTGIKNSISTLLLICGFLVFFCVLGSILDKVGVTNLISEFIQKFFIFIGFSSDIAKDVACRKF